MGMYLTLYLMVTSCAAPLLCFSTATDMGSLRGAAADMGVIKAPDALAVATCLRFCGYISGMSNLPLGSKAKCKLP